MKNLTKITNQDKFYQPIRSKTGLLIGTIFSRIGG